MKVVCLPQAVPPASCSASQLPPGGGQTCPGRGVRNPQHPSQVAGSGASAEAAQRGYCSRTQWHGDGYPAADK